MTVEELRAAPPPPPPPPGISAHPARDKHPHTPGTCPHRCRDRRPGLRRASMVSFPGMQTEARSLKPGPLPEMFDSSWKVRSIWDGVRLEVVEDRSPVVLHSFTHLDPDLPLLEVRRRRRRPGGGGRARGRRLVEERRGGELSQDWVEDPGLGGGSRTGWRIQGDWF
ncbi:unnamed protein product [Pleuronectes platessa]|uniref:Uncharacterized protein n=1 Tax=Pleuronectes platessa TaxID=8262 RepID=A0A9N7Y1G1_PLEPL|nr:unnamed protein product [Pleuronectes platessa]